MLLNVAGRVPMTTPEWLIWAHWQYRHSVSHERRVGRDPCQGACSTFWMILLKSPARSVWPG
jgi:hypothetical protein